MRNIFFWLLPLLFLLGCEMEVPEYVRDIPTPYPAVSDQFDFETLVFNKNLFNSQRSAWKERNYKTYEYDLFLLNRHNREDPIELYPSELYSCTVIVKEGKDPELIGLEGTQPEDSPADYTINGIYDYIFSVMEAFAAQAKETNEKYRATITYSLFTNIPCAVLIDRMEEDGFYYNFREIWIHGLWLPPPGTEKEFEIKLGKFDRETFEQEYNAWKEIGIKNYRYLQYRKDTRLNESGGASTGAVITIQDGKEPQVDKAEGWSSAVPSWEDYTIEGIFNFIASAVEDPSASGLEFWLAYSPEYHIPVIVVAFVPGEDLPVFKIGISLGSFEILSQVPQ
ncbi:MAG: DUF6174 domain-containing protein [Treponema sp.]|jgi:hypothetical protein|nr:DUF6174 domain-containing protein [Treponema sp.]